MKKHGKRVRFKLATMAILAAIIAIAALLLPGIAVAAGASPVGLWRTIDDASGKPRSLIRITENDGELAGRIEKLFRSPERDQNPTCARCGGALKDQPIIGMTILSGLKKDGGGNDGNYSGGQIVDPASGKTYKSKLSVAEDGKKLNVRGYVGLPVLGRTQTWLREE